MLIVDNAEWSGKDELYVYITPYNQHPRHAAVMVLLPYSYHHLLYFVAYNNCVTNNLFSEHFQNKLFRGQHEKIAGRKRITDSGQKTH